MSFSSASQWIWGPEDRNNHFMVFARTVAVPDGASMCAIRITASYHYELFLNGRFVNRGPVHGDPQWCHYDELTHVLADGTRELCVAVVVHHSANIHLHYLTEAPAGLRAEFRLGDTLVPTDSEWRCMTLPMWRDDMPERGGALDYIEEYDARCEPPGWAEKRFDNTSGGAWCQALPVSDADATWGNYERRRVPLIRRRFVAPVSMRAWKAPARGGDKPEDISPRTDLEPLEPVGVPEPPGRSGHAAQVKPSSPETLRPERSCGDSQDAWRPFDIESINAMLGEANAFTLRLEREWAGFAFMEVEAEEGTVIELSTTERLQESGRPWIHRWGGCFSVRYVAREGLQAFHPFAWDGTRYLHIVVRGKPGRVRFRRVGCLARQAPLAAKHNVSIEDPLLDRIFGISRHTLEIGAQELLIDCPTREQAPAWADSLFIAESLWTGFRERSYLEAYLEAYIHAPQDANGQISGRYPTTGAIWLDFTMIPILGQDFHRRRTGVYYRPKATLEKALRLKQWYERNRNAEGLLDFPFKEYYRQGLRTFIDHPGLLHNFPHPGIERDGVSCGLNTFYYAFVRILSRLAEELGHESAASLANEADRLAVLIPKRFYDGTVFHDVVRDAGLSEGTSWQSNGLAVYCELIVGDDATRAMKAMLDGYDTLCRCSPYFHFYFLWALRKVGLEEEALALIKKEWGPMVESGATTTWETFGGDERDSLCHPWSTAPFLFLADTSSPAFPSC